MSAYNPAFNLGAASNVNANLPTSCAQQGADLFGQPVLGALTAVTIGTAGVTMPATPVIYYLQGLVGCRPAQVSVSINASTLTGVTIIDQGYGFINGQQLKLNANAGDAVLLAGSNWGPTHA